MLFLMFLGGLFGNVYGFDTEVVVVRAVRGRDARLPCGQGRVFLDGPNAYVLWIKNDQDFLYRFPNEDSDRRALNRDRIFGTTCDGIDCYDDTALLLKKVGDQDSGTYRCRVHYQASPAIDYVVDVRLVDSPGTPRIFNEFGEEIKKAYVGPLSLGQDITLICEVNDGSHLGSLQYLRVCGVSSVTPAQVPGEKDQPDTLVYWRRNGAILERAHTARPGVLRAELRVLNVTRAELDAHYECLAQNADVTDPLVASVVVKMYLPPLTVEIRINNNVDLEAGQPRVVDCVVIGCVPPPTITWHLGDTLIRPTVHKELHDGNYTVSSMTLAPSLRDNDQDLVCKAHNSHIPDQDYQDKVTLHVGYRPVCLITREETVGVVQREAETITCVVDSSPEPLQFSWTFADSRTLYTSVKKVHGHHHRYSSTLTWLPRDSDIGLLHCRATNTFGEQKKPCSYTISKGGPPNTPDCVVLRSYPSSVRVQCKKGWDGGRPQIIHLELRDVEGTLLHNVSDPAGHFHLPNIEEEQNLTALVYAGNSRGKSGVKTLYLQTVKPLVASAVLDPAPSSWAHWLEGTAGVVAVLAALAATALCVRALKSKGGDVEHSPELVPRSDGSFHREPDFVREERVLGTTNITVNQLASCPNQYSTTPVPSCRVLVGCGHPSTPDTCASQQHSYFV